MRICQLCGGKADTTQHLLPKSVTEPEHYIRIPLCGACHNDGKMSAKGVEDRLMNNINSIALQQQVIVNNHPVLAVAGSVVSGSPVVIPPRAISASFLNKQTLSNNDFRVTREGTAIVGSGATFNNEYMTYIFLVSSCGTPSM